MTVRCEIAQSPSETGARSLEDLAPLSQAVPALFLSGLRKAPRKRVPTTTDRTVRSQANQIACRHRACRVERPV